MIITLGHFTFLSSLVMVFFYVVVGQLITKYLALKAGLDHLDGMQKLLKECDCSSGANQSI